MDFLPLTAATSRDLRDVTGSLSAPGFTISEGCGRGGVYGPSDWPFIDFHCDSFLAADFLDNHLSGALALNKIPESWLLLGLGLLGIVTVIEIGQKKPGEL